MYDVPESNFPSKVGIGIGVGVGLEVGRRRWVSRIKKRRVQDTAVQNVKETERYSCQTQSMAIILAITSLNSVVLVIFHLLKILAMDILWIWQKVMFELGTVKNNNAICVRFPMIRGKKKSINL